jgi:hypothetical protein
LDLLGQLSSPAPLLTEREIASRVVDLGASVQLATVGPSIRSSASIRLALPDMSGSGPQGDRERECL